MKKLIFVILRSYRPYEMYLNLRTVRKKKP